MSEVFVLLSVVGPIAIVVALLVIGILSQHLDEVVKMGQLYRWFYVATAIASISIVVRLLSISFAKDDFLLESEDTAFSLAYTVPLTISIVIGLIVTWRYWGWLVYASDTFTPARPTKTKD